MQIRIIKQDSLSNNKSVKRFLESFIVPRFLTTIRAKFNRRLIENYVDVFDVNAFVTVFLKVKFLRVHEVGDKYFVVDINPNIKLSDGTLFIDCCKAINYGSLSLQSYPIFESCFRVF